MTTSSSRPDVVLIGAGIMSATLAVILKELDPSLKIELYEVLGSEAQESSNAWNNAGTGHAALCELNYTPQNSDGSIDISKALQVNTEFDLSRQLWAYLVKKGAIKDPQSFIHPVPHYTGPDGNSHVIRGSVTGGELVQAESILFKETPAHSSFDWHNDPIPQYVITLAGVLEFTTKTGDTFTIHPGEILLAVDHTGSGHKWRLVNDEPWKRAYLVFKEGADTHFVPDQSVAQ